jgi:hypothetical protein
MCVFLYIYICAYIHAFVRTCVCVCVCVERETDKQDRLESIHEQILDDLKDTR